MDLQQARNWESPPARKNSQCIALGLRPDLNLGLADVPAADSIYCHNSLSIKADEASLFVMAADRSPPFSFTDSAAQENFRVESSFQATRLLGHTRHSRIMLILGYSRSSSYSCRSMPSALWSSWSLGTRTPPGLLARAGAETFGTQATCA